MVIDSLADQGLTNSRAFSMDLRGFDSARGRFKPQAPSSHPFMSRVTGH
jgi:hypothetical protein